MVRNQSLLIYYAIKFIEYFLNIIYFSLLLFITIVIIIIIIIFIFIITIIIIILLSLFCILKKYFSFTLKCTKNLNFG